LTSCVTIKKIQSDPLPLQGWRSALSKGETSEERPLVGIIMGSDTDLPVMNESAKMLAQFSIPFEIEVISAHRSPARMHEYASTAISRGLKAVIVAAGGAAHLAGVVAALTTLPVIAVPMATTVLSGIDALLSSVQMPAGVPVAAMAIDKPGAINAAIYAAEIIATFDPLIAEQLVAYKQELARSVAEKSARVKQQFAEKSAVK
jgi:phosphoribosylaminoimidazole carboxylase PurE protein